LKIAIIHTDFGLYWCARLKALTEVLAKSGFEIFIIEISGISSHLSWELENRCFNSDWICLFPGRSMQEISSREAKSSVMNKLDVIKPDILISGPIAFPSGAAAVDWSVKNSKRLIVFDDARIEDVPRPVWINYIKRLVYSPVNAIFCPSKNCIKTFNFFGFQREEIFYGVNAVDNDFWNKDCHKKTNNKEATNYFLAVGRLIPKKNFIFLLKVYKKYIQQARDNYYNLIIIGEGSEEKSLKSYIVENGLNKYVSIQKFVSPEKLKERYKNASLLILPSKYGETWGLVVNEAMASGLPVLVSRQAGCASSLVLEGVNGFAFSPENEDQLADLLIYISTLSYAERKLMGEASREIINEYGINNFCEGLSRAIAYAKTKDIKKPGLLARIIISLWNGRYRPV
jgi:glycosyltransferase involved in cell wall biosynthesis